VVTIDERALHSVETTMVNYVSPLLFLVLLAVGAPVAARVATNNTMAKSPGAMHLRTLQTIDGLGPSASNTVVLAVPVEMMESLSGLKEMLRSRPF
jgi:hypothetical protein